MDSCTPEFYGYKIGQNIVPYINKCIAENGECQISEGEHVFGRNDSDQFLGHIWSDSCITWGWQRKDDVKIIGAGIDKTIFKLVDKVNTKEIFGKKALNIKMISTNYNESCNNNWIEGITFDGNYDNNNESSTLAAIHIRGSNNTVKNCKFINFGVGQDQQAECFQLFLTTFRPEDKGPNIISNVFEKMGNKRNSKSGHCPENTIVAAAGTNSIIRKNIFNNCLFHSKDQQSPLHGISIGESFDTEISENIFNKFQGACFYVDSWRNERVNISNNTCTDVWNFINLTCQTWDDEKQISFNKDFNIVNNKITLSSEDVYYQHDALPIVSCFFSYNYDPRLDRNKFPAFQNIIAKNNKVTLGFRESQKGVFQESSKLICFWGAPIDDSKIKLTDNEFISTLIKPLEKTFWQKIKGFFQKLLGKIF